MGRSPGLSEAELSVGTEAQIKDELDGLRIESRGTEQGGLGRGDDAVRIGLDEAGAVCGAVCSMLVGGRG